MCGPLNDGLLLSKHANQSVSVIFNERDDDNGVPGRKASSYTIPRRIDRVDRNFDNGKVDDAEVWDIHEH